MPNSIKCRSAGRRRASWRTRAFSSRSTARKARCSNCSRLPLVVVRRAPNSSSPVIDRVAFFFCVLKFSVCADAGHSLGGALSTIAAAWLATQQAALPFASLSLVNFGAPRVGDPNFAAWFGTLNVSLTQRMSEPTFVCVRAPMSSHQTVVERAAWHRDPAPRFPPQHTVFGARAVVRRASLAAQRSNVCALSTHRSHTLQLLLHVRRHVHACADRAVLRRQRLSSVQRGQRRRSKLQRSVFDSESV